MKSIRNWNGLAQYGIIPLTGEADRTGQRMLCDITMPGKKIVEDLLGLTAAVLNPSYNGRGAAGSMMLPYNLFNDLAAWCLLVHDKCDEVFYIVGMCDPSTSLRPEGGVHGKDGGESTEEWNEHIEFLRGLGAQIRRIRIRTEHPGVGTRCTHMFTGRTM